MGRKNAAALKLFLDGRPCGSESEKQNGPGGCGPIERKSSDQIGKNRVEREKPERKKKLECS